MLGARHMLLTTQVLVRGLFAPHALQRTGVVPKFSSSIVFWSLLTHTFVATDIVPLPCPSAFRCISTTVNG